jgi:type III pantothenate kinase
LFCAENQTRIEDYILNIIAIDIGNTNINIGLFIDGTEQFIETADGGAKDKILAIIEKGWNKIPFSKSAKEKVRDGSVIVSSVKPEWTDQVRQLLKEHLGEKIMIIGQEIPLPMELAVDEPKKVGTDRITAAAAAYAVVEQALVVADFGTAITIDLVDDKGVFLGGIIAPGLSVGARALNEYTAVLPMVKLSKPNAPWGSNTEAAINCGIYYGAVGLLHEVVRRYAEKIDKWPYTVITGGDAALIKDDCEFIDSYVPNLTVKGIALAYRNYLDAKGTLEEE